MKIKTYKRTNKFYEDIYTREKETKEVEIELDNGYIIRITEHQLGQILNVPHIDIICEKGCYGMDMQAFIKKITL